MDRLTHGGEGNMSNGERLKETKTEGEGQDNVIIISQRT